MPNLHINDWDTGDMIVRDISCPCIRCKKCKFVGTENQLLDILDDGEYIRACPNCKTDWYLESYATNQK